MKSFNLGIRAVLILPLLAVMSIACQARADDGAVEKDNPLNLALPTMGGKQIWTDSFYHDGWRIQENALTGHFRLLDPQNVRRAWGDYEDCHKAYARINGLKDGPARKQLVILLHGILRSGGSFNHLASALEGEGYEVARLSYASTQLSLEQHGRNLNRLMARLEDVERVSFVTHSMGALVLRQALASSPEWRNRIELEAVVMIAPPNRGSALAAVVRPLLPYRVIYGQAGQQLTPGALERLPVPEGVPFAVIAGGLGDDNGYNPLLDGDDDSVVSVSETTLPGMADFLVLPALHSTILSDPDTAGAVLSFLDHGSFTLSREED